MHEQKLPKHHRWLLTGIALLLCIPLGTFSFLQPSPAKAAVSYCSAYPSGIPLTSWNTSDGATHNGAPPSDWGVQTGSYNWGSGSVSSCNNNTQSPTDPYPNYISGVYSNGNLITTFDSSGNLNTVAGGEAGDAFQCIELIERYAKLRWNDPVTSWVGNAGDTWSANQHPSHFDEETNGTSIVAPQAGDILVWVGGSGGAGHIAIVQAVNPSTQTITTLEQNFYFYATHPNPGGWYGDLSSRNITYSMSSGKYTLSQQYSVGTYTATMDAPVTGWFHDKGTAVNPSFSDHEVYTIGSNGDLYHYFYNGTSWSASPQEDLSTSTGLTGVTLQGTVSSYYLGGNHFAYAIDTAHHLHEFWYASGWHHQDLTQTIGGRTFQGSPNGYGFVSSGNHHSINAIGSDGKLYNVYYPSSSGNWGVTSALSTQTMSGSPSGYAVVTNTSYFELVYVVDSSGTLREYAHSGTTWSNPNSWASFGGYSLTGTPSAYAFTDSQGHQDHDVYVQGSDGHLYDLRYIYTGTGSSGYAWQVPNAPISSNVTMGSVPNAHISYGSPSTHFVFVETSSGALEEFYQDEGNSTWNATAIVASGVANSPWSYSYFASTTLTHIVFWPGTDGHLYEKYYQYPNWSSNIDRGALSSSVTINSGVSAYGF